MEKGYRIPKESEFVQGFEYEVKESYKFGILYFNSKGEKSNIQMSKEPYEVWNKGIVSWKSTKPSSHTDKDGYTVHIMPEVNNFFVPFDVKAYLEQGLLRAKDGEL